MKKQNRSAALRGSRRKTVAAKCPPVDAYRDVRGAEAAVELLQTHAAKHRATIARLLAQRSGVERAIRAAAAKLSAIDEALLALSPAAGAANEKLSHCDETEKEHGRI